MIDTVKFFEEKKYVLIKEMIPKEIIKRLSSQYSHFDRVRKFQPDVHKVSNT